MENGQSAAPSSGNETLRTFKDKFLSYIWDSDAHLKTPFERRLIRKLDFGILVVSCLGFFMRYLDSANLTNAYVSGMKEDLNILGNEYTYMGTCYTIAYALFQIPGTLIVTRVRPSYFLFFCEVGWGALTFAQAGARHSNYMYAFRFCVGMFEAPFFPCILCMSSHISLTSCLLSNDQTSWDRGTTNMRWLKELPSFICVDLSALLLEGTYRQLFLRLWTEPGV
ncbi:major facilitator superfamily domain-containing protein [Armillaria fumosa]|nr:major facilitator superfamily domain-containing protein [Armillaria fumosa]